MATRWAAPRRHRTLDDTIEHLPDRFANPAIRMTGRADECGAREYMDELESWLRHDQGLPPPAINRISVQPEPSVFDVCQALGYTISDWLRVRMETG